MLHNENRIPIGGPMTLLLVILNVIIIRTAFVSDESLYRALLITLPLLVLSLVNTNRWTSENEKGLNHD